MESQNKTDTKFLEILSSRYKGEIAQLNVKIAAKKSRLPRISRIPNYPEYAYNTITTALVRFFLLALVSVIYAIYPNIISTFIIVVILSYYLIELVLYLYNDIFKLQLQEFFFDIQMKRIQRLEEIIRDLSIELERVSKKLNEIHISTQITQFEDNITHNSDEDCDHLRELLNTHIKVVRILEIQQAEQGREFHYSKRIDLEERKARINELQGIIKRKC